jgi:hypothetical protein
MKKAFGVALLLSATIALVAVGAYGQTFIRTVLPNPASAPATGFRFEMVTPGEVLQAVLRSDTVLRGNAEYKEASYRANTPTELTGVRLDPASLSFPFQGTLPVNGKIDMRVAFTPKEYWKVYFNDMFQYADGRSVHSRIPYAAFYINFTPTADPEKVIAALTVVNSLGSTYGVPKFVVNNDDGRLPLNVEHAQVYINNSLKNYDLTHFDLADGQRVDLPDSFTLGAGESQTFNLGVVKRNSYVYTMSQISYVGRPDEQYPIACAHAPQN